MPFQRSPAPLAADDWLFPPNTHPTPLAGSPSPVRVLFWADLFWPYIGGPECFSARLIPALRDLGYEFLIITSHHDRDLPDEDSIEGIPIYRFPFRQALACKDLSKVAHLRDQAIEVTQSFAPALIHVGALGPSVLFCLMTCQTHRVPLLATVQHQLLQESAQPRSLLASLLDRADWVRTVSVSVMNELQQWKPELQDRSSVIYSFVEGAGYSRIKAVSFSPPIVLCIGRLIPIKGFDLAILALARIIEEFPDARLLIAGDGVHRDALKSLVKAEGLCDNVSFIGWIRPECVWETMDTASMVLIPSRREGLPTVAIQAALAQRPIVAADVGGVAEIVIPDQTGKLVKKEDVGSLAEAVCTLLNRPDHARRLAAAARRHALNTFSKTSCIAAFDKLYRQLSHCAGAIDGNRR